MRGVRTLSRYSMLPAGMRFTERKPVFVNISLLLFDMYN